MGRRFFRHGELHLVILVLLSGRALHGYELMGELGHHFGPAYRASPGSVYPAVKALTAEGLLAPEQDGDRTRYRTTRAGEEAVAARRDELVRLEERTGTRLGTADQLERSLERLAARVRAVGGRVDPDRVAHLLDEVADEIEQLEQAHLRG
jgi:DNA-binding PadR family transcriptional regulator